MATSSRKTLLFRLVTSMIFLFLFVGFSITNSVVFLHVFSWMRKLVCGLSDKDFFKQSHRGELKGFRRAFLGRLVHCHACMGFWVGVLLSLKYEGFIIEYMEIVSKIESVVIDGFLLSGFNFCLWVVLRKLGAEEM